MMCCDRILHPLTCITTESAQKPALQAVICTREPLQNISIIHILEAQRFTCFLPPRLSAISALMKLLFKGVSYHKFKVVSLKCLLSLLAFWQRLAVGSKKITFRHRLRGPSPQDPVSSLRDPFIKTAYLTQKE